MPAASLFPPTSLQEARVLADTIARSGAGQPMRRIDIFDVLQRSAESGPSRNLVTASRGFGLTTGGYQADHLALTDLGRRLAVEGDETAAIDSILSVEIFKRFFETYANAQLPAEVAARSFLATHGVPTERVGACFELVVANGRYAGLIAQRSGSDYVLTREHAVESRQRGGPTPVGAEQAGGTRGVQPPLHTPRQAPVPPAPAAQLPALHINVEIHLPSDQTPETYDAIFSSMRKHLIDGRSVAQPE